MKETLAERFGKHVAKGGADECWNWTGSMTKWGYGKVKVHGRDVAAHRLAYELANGAIPAGLCVLHSCDNRVCCNPAHLRLGTNQDNIADKVAKGRQARTRGETVSKLTAAQVQSIRATYASGGTSHRKLAEAYGVSYKQVYRILKGEDWGWMP